MLEEALRQVVDDLRASGARWALVGGLAVCARAEPRPTADIDIAVAVPDDATAKATVDNLLAAGYRSRESIVHDQTGRLATVRLLSPVAGGDVAVDLFFASSGVEAEVVGAAESLEVRPGLTIPVARIGHLIAVKLCWRSSAKRDRDLRTLIERADTEDLEDARHLVALITERGYHRGRDLGAALDSWLSHLRHYGESVAKNATVYARLGRQLDHGHWQTLIPAGSGCTIDQDSEGRTTTFRWSGGALTFHRMRDPEVGPHLLGLEGYLRDIGAPAGLIVRALSTQAVYGVVADHDIEQGVSVELVMNLTQRSEGFCFVANGAVIDGEGRDLIDDLELPDAGRVATRALILLATTYRWVVESSIEDEPDVATEEWERLQQWLDDVDLSGEAEPGETEFLRCALGTVALDDVAVHAFDAEAAHTLIWALDEFSFPELAPRGLPANLCFMFRVPGVGPFTPGRPPVLRPTGEIDGQWRQTQAVHWRLADQGLRPRQFDFARWAQDTWFGAVDVSGLELIDGDLSIQGTSISSLDEARLWWLTRQVTERHRALNWLIGAHPRYRSVSTPT